MQQGKKTEGLKTGLDILEKYPRDKFPFKSGEATFETLVSLKKDKVQGEMFRVQHMETMFWMKRGQMLGSENLEGINQKRNDLIEIIKTETE